MIFSKLACGELDEAVVDFIFYFLFKLRNMVVFLQNFLVNFYCIRNSPVFLAKGSVVFHIFICFAPLFLVLYHRLIAGVHLREEGNLLVQVQC